MCRAWSKPRCTSPLISGDDVPDRFVATALPKSPARMPHEGYRTAMGPPKCARTVLICQFWYRVSASRYQFRKFDASPFGDACPGFHPGTGSLRAASASNAQ